MMKLFSEIHKYTEKTALFIATGISLKFDETVIV